MRRTKIICTLGPAVDSEDMIRTLIRTGMDAARDKRNYVSLLGVETAQELVESYTGQAVDALGIFPQDQSFLAELAQALANRDS